MLEGTEFNEVFDDYTSDEVSYLIEDEVLNSIESKGSFEEDSKLDIEPSEEAKMPQKREVFPNHDLRLLNAYFKELGTEPLRTSRDEIEIAAQIRKCEIRAKETQRVIERTIGKRLGCDIKSALEELKEVSDKSHNTSKTEMRSKRL